MPIESFVKALIDWTFFLMAWAKLASVGFVAARDCMRQQVLDSRWRQPECGRSQSATTCDSSYSQIVHSTTPYYKVLLRTTNYYKISSLYCKVLLQYYWGAALYYKVLLRTKVLQSTTPVLLCSTKYFSVLQRTTKDYKVLLQYYYVLQSTTPVLYSPTTLYYKVLLCSTMYYSSTTKYYSSISWTSILESGYGWGTYVTAVLDL